MEPVLRGGILIQFQVSPAGHVRMRVTKQQHQLIPAWVYDLVMAYVGWQLLGRPIEFGSLIDFIEYMHELGEPNVDINLVGRCGNSIPIFTEIGHSFSDI